MTTGYSYKHIHSDVLAVSNVYNKQPIWRPVTFSPHQMWQRPV